MVLGTILSTSGILFFMRTSTLTFVSFLAGSVALLHGQLISEAKGQKFTEEHFKLASSLVSFMTNETPTEQEKAALRTALIKEFQADPKSFINGVQEVRQILTDARKLQNPMQIAFGRIALVSFYYGAAQQLPQDKVPALLRLVFAKNPVLAYHAESKIALTSKDLDAALRFLWFTNGVAEPKPADRQAMQEAGKVLTANFTALSDEQKQFLAASAITMPLVDQQWKSMNAAQKRQFMTRYNSNWNQAVSAGQVQQAKPVPDSTPTRKLDADTYRFLSRMSLQNHVSMLNGIEAMGGSGDYWSIRPLGEW